MCRFGRLFIISSFEMRAKTRLIYTQLREFSSINSTTTMEFFFKEEFQNNQRFGRQVLSTHLRKRARPVSKKMHLTCCN